MREQRLHQRRLVLEALVAALARLARLVRAALHHLHVGEDELRVDDLDVAQRVRAALDVDDVLVVEAADNVDDGVRPADVFEELVAESLPLARAADEPRDVHKLDDRRGLLLRLVERAQPLQPLIRHGNNADVRLDRAERIIRTLRPRIRQRVEQRRFSNIGQAHDT